MESELQQREISAKNVRVDVTNMCILEEVAVRKMSYSSISGNGKKIHSSKH